MTEMERISEWIAGFRPAVDPLCLCGKPAPCPDHGQYAGQPHVSGGPRKPVNGFVVLREMQDADHHSERPFTRKAVS